MSKASNTVIDVRVPAASRGPIPRPPITAGPVEQARQPRQKRPKKRDNPQPQERSDSHPQPIPPSGPTKPVMKSSEEVTSQQVRYSSIAARSAAANTLITPTTPQSAVVGHAEKAEQKFCVVCTEPIQIHYVAKCNHRDICYMCGVRQRIRFENKKCVICNADGDQLVITRDSSTPFEEFKLSKLIYDSEWQVYFDGPELEAAATAIRQFRCIKCNTVFGSLKRLKDHLRQEHLLQMCKLCVEHGPFFVTDQRLYTQTELKEHISKGGEWEGRKFNGHPSCNFCRKAFYDNDHLYSHMRVNHEACHVCRRQDEQLQFQYFANFDALDRHLRAAHFVCDHADCTTARGSSLTSVFGTEFELRQHQLKAHPTEMSRRARDQAYRVTARDFETTRRSEVRGPQQQVLNTKPQDIELPQTLEGPSAPDKDDSDLAAALAASRLDTTSPPPPRTITPAAAPAATAQPEPQELSADEVARRNKALVQKMREALRGDDASFQSFRQLSGSFRAGKIGAQEYYDRFERVFGDASRELFGELVVLLPDREKQQQLSVVYQAALVRDRNFPRVGDTRMAGAAAPVPHASWSDHAAGRSATINAGLGGPLRNLDFPQLPQACAPVAPVLVSSAPEESNWARAASTAPQQQQQQQQQPIKKGKKKGRVLLRFG